MISIQKHDRLHKIQLQKLLIAVVDNPTLSQSLYFKGGTCAAMLGYLDRFSVDLDFDLIAGSDPAILRLEFNKIFKSLDLKIENNNEKTLFFELKYQAPTNRRNTLKISANEEMVKSNDYKKVKIQEIDRFITCQTIETMFANKLVSVIDRYNRHKRIAGRDIYDVNYFFQEGYDFKEEIIKERTGMEAKEYIKKLLVFIEKEVTEDLINRDLNILLPIPKFTKIRKTLKQDTLLFLRNLI